MSLKEFYFLVLIVSLIMADLFLLFKYLNILDRKKKHFDFTKLNNEKNDDKDVNFWHAVLGIFSLYVMFYLVIFLRSFLSELLETKKINNNSENDDGEDDEE